MNYKDALEKSGIVYPEGWGTGFPLWTEKGWKFQNKTLENLMQQYSADFDIMVHYPAVATRIDTYSNMYGSRMIHYDNSLPSYIDEGNEMMIITDSLPYNMKCMKENSFDAMLTYYYVVRLLKSKKIPLYRDYYISPLLQLNLSISTMNKEDSIAYVVGKTQLFLRNIGLPSVVLEYDGVPGYSEKVYMFAACNSKNNLSTIVQCSLLDQRLLDSFGVAKHFEGNYVFDLGYSQKLFAFIADNNLDYYGVRWPSFFGQKDVAIVYKHFTDIQLNTLWNYSNIILDNRLGKKKLKSIKNELVNTGVRYLFVQRERGNKKFFSFFSKNGMTEVDFDEMVELIQGAKEKLDNEYYSRSEYRMNQQISFGKGYVSEFSNPGKVVNYI